MKSSLLARYLDDYHRVQNVDMADKVVLDQVNDEDRKDDGYYSNLSETSSRNSLDCDKSLPPTPEACEEVTKSLVSPHSMRFMDAEGQSDAIDLSGVGPDNYSTGTASVVKKSLSESAKYVSNDGVIDLTGAPRDPLMPQQMDYYPAWDHRISYGKFIERIEAYNSMGNMFPMLAKSTWKQNEENKVREQYYQNNVCHSVPSGRRLDSGKYQPSSSIKIQKNAFLSVGASSSRQNVFSNVVSSRESYQDGPRSHVKRDGSQMEIDCENDHRRNETAASRRSAVTRNSTSSLEGYIDRDKYRNENNANENDRAYDRCARYGVDSDRPTWVSSNTAAKSTQVHCSKLRREWNDELADRVKKIPAGHAGETWQCNGSNRPLDPVYKPIPALIDMTDDQTRSRSSDAATRYALRDYLPYPSDGIYDKDRRYIGNFHPHWESNAVRQYAGRFHSIFDGYFKDQKHGTMESTSSGAHPLTHGSMKDTSPVSSDGQPVVNGVGVNGDGAPSDAEPTQVKRHSPPVANGHDTGRSDGDTTPAQAGPPVLNHHATVQPTMQQPPLNQQQLQQLLQQQSLLMSHQHQNKFHEQIMAQLNEQLQVNMVQQSQLLHQGDKNKNSKQLHQQLQQLSKQQHQILQQIQIQQRQFLMSQRLGFMPSFPLHQGMTPAELQQLWKEVTSAKCDDGKPTVNGAANIAPAAPVITSQPFLPNGAAGDAFFIPGPLLVGLGDDTPGSHPLYIHSVCRWPGCEQNCADYPTFIQHLNTEHQLDDRSTAQARVQMQIVSQLELQLAKERDRLQAMMQHLHVSQQRAVAEAKVAETFRRESTSSLQTSSNQKSPSSPQSSANRSISELTKSRITMAMTQNSPTGQSHLAMNHSSGAPGPIRRRVSDKNNLPVCAEIQKNREFYKNTDIRPPFTYASLIRQGITESPHKQLTLNEIYQWFQNTFAYFRRNEATWKNAVRHNLSLHKCFMRVENVKGAVWTVDEDEFYRRRPQKLQGSKVMQSKYDGQSPQLLTNGQYTGGHIDYDVAEDLSVKAQYLSSMSDESLLQDEELIAEIKREVIEELTGINPSSNVPKSPENQTSDTSYGNAARSPAYEPVDLSPNQSAELLTIPQPTFLSNDRSSASIDITENPQSQSAQYSRENNESTHLKLFTENYSDSDHLSDNLPESTAYSNMEDPEVLSHYAAENSRDYAYCDSSGNHSYSNHSVKNPDESKLCDSVEISQKDVVPSHCDKDSPTNLSSSDFSYQVTSHPIVT